jgi:hypothetical protein
MPITTTPSGGPQGEFSTYTPIYSTTVSSSTQTITFSNIPQGYTDLKVITNVRLDYSPAGFSAYFNGDNSPSYSNTSLGNANGTTSSSRRTSQSSISVLELGAVDTATSQYTLMNWDILNYSNTTTFKNSLISSGSNNSSNYGVGKVVALYRSTSQITSITFDATSGRNILAGSTFTLYGIKAAATQFIPVNAAGGDYAVTDGTYAYHVFTSSGVFAPAKSLSCDVLVVAGGAGSGTNQAGGGGAGGLLAFTSESLSTTAYTVTVGAGGAYNSTGTSVNGSDSQFGALTLVKGGGGTGGAPGYSVAGVAGGSGGGGSGAFSPIPTGGAGGAASPSGQGSAGGAGGNWTTGTISASGGGGGATGAGSNGAALSTGAGGAGGAGSSAYSSWGIATGTGQNVAGTYWYAGGGGGAGGNNTSTPGAGGAGGNGGGGLGGQGTSTAGSGLVNTGGGGGGRSSQSNVGNGTGGAGGSGIVIVRYPL